MTANSAAPAASVSAIASSGDSQRMPRASSVRGISM
jgi:hypothetical protein